jgi:putative ABC transport system permease protein
MIPFAYSHRNLRVRWKTTLMTASGFTLVVAALVVMLAFVNGILEVCTLTGEPENVLVLSRGNADEVLSRIDREAVLQIEDDPGIAHNSSGRLLSSREAFLPVNQRVGTQTLQVRGVTDLALEVHPHIKIIEGEMLRPGRGEVILGRAIQQELGLKLGDNLEIGQKMRHVCGIFSSEGSVFEIEVWADLTELLEQFRREGTYSTIVLATPDRATAELVAKRLTDTRRLSVEAVPEPAYYLEQAEQTNSLRAAGITVALFMGIGAVFGITNTMFAAIEQRTKDIAVLRLLGFRKHEILISFLIEAMLIALIGGCLGSALGYCVNGLSVNSGLSTKAIAFAFSVDAPSILIALMFTLLLGIVGGILPALAAMRVDPLQSLR